MHLLETLCIDAGIPARNGFGSIISETQFSIAKIRSLDWSFSCSNHSVHRGAFLFCLVR